MICLCLAATLAVYAETVDSGWAVGKPSVTFPTASPANPTFRVAINNVLQQSELPLLRAATPPDNSAADTTGDASDEARDGWQAVTAPPVVENDCAGASTRDAEVHFRAPRGDARPRVATPRHAATASSAPTLPPATPLDLNPTAVDDAAESDDDDADRPIAKNDSVADDSTDIDSTNEPDAQPEPATTRIDNSADGPFKTSPPSSVQDEKPLPPLSRSMKNLRSKVRNVLKGYAKKPLNSRDNDPWEMMHGMLAYGLQSQLRQGGPQGNPITSVGWLCYNQPCKGYTLLYVTPEGELRGKQGVGLQGHMGQFLAMLAQCQVSEEYPIRVGKREFTIRDLIEAEKKTCYPKTELTFKLIALMHYLDSDAKWVNDQGLEWTIPRLIREELAQPIRGAACGGCHRLAGLSLAARTRVRRGEPLDGEYARAAEFVENYERYAFQLQSSDGSLSTEWFRGRGDDSDIDRRCKTTGHILEWLCYTLSDDELRANRTFKAVNYLSTLLASNYDHDWEKGPRSHAIHALKLYDERVFQPHDGREEIATSPGKRSTSVRQPASRSKQR